MSNALLLVSRYRWFKEVISCTRRDGVVKFGQAMQRLPTFVSRHPALFKRTTYTVLGAAAGGSIIAIVSFSQESSGSDAVKVMNAFTELVGNTNAKDVHKITKFCSMCCID